MDQAGIPSCLTGAPRCLNCAPRRKGGSKQGHSRPVLPTHRCRRSCGRAWGRARCPRCACPRLQQQPGRAGAAAGEPRAQAPDVCNSHGGTSWFSALQPSPQHPLVPGAWLAWPPTLPPTPAPPHRRTDGQVSLERHSPLLRVLAHAQQLAVQLVLQPLHKLDGGVPRLVRPRQPLNDLQRGQRRRGGRQPPPARRS